MEGKLVERLDDKSSLAFIFKQKEENFEAAQKLFNGGWQNFGAEHSSKFLFFGNLTEFYGTKNVATKNGKSFWFDSD